MQAWFSDMARTDTVRSCPAVMVRRSSHDRQAIPAPTQHQRFITLDLRDARRAGDGSALPQELDKTPVYILVLVIDVRVPIGCGLKAHKVTSARF